MMGDLKIKIIKDPETGEDCVPPNVMDLLRRLAAHRDICDECGPAWHNKTGAYCATGQEMLNDLLADPNVEYVNVRPG